MISKTIRGSTCKRSIGGRDEIRKIILAVWRVGGVATRDDRILNFSIVASSTRELYWWDRRKEDGVVKTKAKHARTGRARGRAWVVKIRDGGEDGNTYFSG